MGLGDLQIYDIIIFAGVAIFLVIRLRKVLGRRTGFEKNNSKTTTPETKDYKEKTQPQNIPELNDNIIELKKAYENLEGVDHKKFIEGAKLAFESIIKTIVLVLSICLKN